MHVAGPSTAHGAALAHAELRNCARDTPHRVAFETDVKPKAKIVRFDPELNSLPLNDKFSYAQ